MKKLILPILIAVVSLTSCSKALYKDKYNWVKVDRAPLPVRVDSLMEKTEVFRKSPAEAAMDIYETIASSDSMESSQKITGYVEGEEQPLKDSGQDPDTMCTQEIANEKSMLADQQTTQQNRAHFGQEKKRGLRDVDWAGVLYEVVIFGVIILLIVYKDNPTVALISSILQLIVALASIVAIIWAIFWLCKIFMGFVFMMDN